MCWFLFCFCKYLYIFFLVFTNLSLRDSIFYRKGELIILMLFKIFKLRVYNYIITFLEKILIKYNDIKEFINYKNEKSLVNKLIIHHLINTMFLKNIKIISFILFFFTVLSCYLLFNELFFPFLIFVFWSFLIYFFFLFVAYFLFFICFQYFLCVFFFHFFLLFVIFIDDLGFKSLFFIFVDEM
jgi:hypothetical protein